MKIVLPFIVILCFISCERESRNCPPAYCCNTVEPTAEDISILSMYKAGDTVKYLYNGQDTMIFIVSDTTRVVSSIRSAEFNPEKDCSFPGYVNYMACNMDLIGINKSMKIQKIEMQVQASSKLTPSGYPIEVTEACKQKSGSDSTSYFHLEFNIDYNQFNPHHRVTYNTTPDDLLYNKSKVVNNFKVLDSTYDYVCEVGEPSELWYFHRKHGVVKFNFLSNSKLELIR